MFRRSHCEIILFTLWNIIHRVVTLWNIFHRVATLWSSIVHTVEYYPQDGHTVKHFLQGGHTVKFYCSHCGILFTGWSHWEIFSTGKFYCSHCGILSTGWPHCEILLFTLWNIFHRVATLWNHHSQCERVNSHCEIEHHYMWTLCGKPHCGGVHTVNTVFTESTMWTHCEHTVGHYVFSGNFNGRLCNHRTSFVRGKLETRKASSFCDFWLKNYLL